MNVVIVDRAGQPVLDGAVARVSKSLKPGRRAIAVSVDVTKPEDYERLCAQVYAEFNDCGLIHLNAGLSAHTKGFENETSAFVIPIQDWVTTFNVNVYGVLHGLRAFVPRMIASGKECVVAATSSYAGLINSGQQGFGGHLPYSGSKHVVTLVMEALQHELRSTPDCKVRATCLHPALVNTNFAKNAAAATMGVERGGAAADAETNA